ncbi:MAG TPA: DNA repair protein RecO C-terminal domain-containing protein [Planctomycetota bacterium]|nr:DNA repair protein RecO C-terminal domain-containing protein [Planctomycetota bacterium]
MAILKDHAQVLRVYEQGNTSQVVVFLGRRLGQFRVHAKGARRWPKKGFEAGFDLLARGEILTYPRRGETLWLIREWDEHARPRLGASLNRLRMASFFCELAEALTRPRAGSAVDLENHARVNDPDDSERLYDALAHAADRLGAGAMAGPVVLQFALKALKFEGLLPDVMSCAGCERKLSRLPDKEWPVWLTASGLTCAVCRRKQAAIPSRERGTLLGQEAWRAMLHIGKTGTPAKMRLSAAEQLGRALIILVHGALEHDLRTLVSAARAVRAIGMSPSQRPALTPDPSPTRGEGKSTKR